MNILTKHLLIGLSLFSIFSTAHGAQVGDEGISAEHLGLLNAASRFTCTIMGSDQKKNVIELSKAPNGRPASWVRDSSDHPGTQVVDNVLEYKTDKLTVTVSQIAVFKNSSLLRQITDVAVSKAGESPIGTRIEGSKVNLSLSQNDAEFTADNKTYRYITALLECDYQK